MSIYYEGLKKYFRGKLKEAAETLHKAGCEYIYTGDLDKAKEAFYHAGKALYDYQRVKRRDLNDLVHVIVYFKASEAKRDLIELINEIRRLEIYSKSVDFRNQALILFISALESYDVRDTIKEIDELIDAWNHGSRRIKRNTMGAYILLQISRNILLGRKEVVKSLWLRYENEIYRAYPKFIDLLRLMIHGFLES